MGQYYYTVSSLPYLSIESKPEYSIDDFINHCSAELSNNDLEILSEVSLVPKDSELSGLAILINWQAYTRSFRNYLVNLRAKNLNREAKNYLRQGKESFEAYIKAKQVSTIENPLEAENALIKGHFDYLYDLQVGHFFDLEFLIIYKLKLQLLIRKFSFIQELGIKNFDKIDEHFSSIISSGGIHE